ncbi:pentatricopeptide repeat-containing protein mitochondrial-like [Dorcoceras hygrometricum]|uniref:Pentatricopeptide repeat-containing protein mitochondrial-like n=1 Tax=Dorcoceras hygrometricum TaxID=472368 RepID=A0A2Z7BJ33_9LAMI|nr:pentatricopeptide repeat-containing protein mitochondrial-like [Dorcoceras hygrometricum]
MTFIGCFSGLHFWRLGAWLQPVSRGNRHFTVGGGRLRQLGPRSERGLLRQPALEGLARSRVRILLVNIGYPRMSASGESSTTMHRLLHASGSHPIPPPDDPKTNQYKQDLGLIHSKNGNHLESPNEGSSIDHQVTIYLHAQNITMFPTNETCVFQRLAIGPDLLTYEDSSRVAVSCKWVTLTQTTQNQENKYEVKPQYEELSKHLIMQHAIINAMKCMGAIKDRIGKQLKHNFKTEENTYPKAYTSRGKLGQDFTESLERTGSSCFLKSTVPVSKLVSIDRETQEEFSATNIIKNNGGTRRQSTKEYYDAQ